MGRYARVLPGLVISAIIVGHALAWPVPASAGAVTPNQPIADLDGVPIDLEEVANWYCDDFSYPAIHCFRDPKNLEARRTSILATTAVTYVTIYDYTSFAGSYMHVSEDYTALVFLGWNDRISSYKARNSEDGHFYVDWYYGGTGYYFCCNQQASFLGSFDNQFSSVHRN